MKKVKFYFKLVAKGKLESVSFIPEEANQSIKIKPDDDDKIWINEEFELVVNNPFEYKLKVFGVSGTKWEAQLLDITNGKKVIIEWTGVTGDTSNNISERTMPQVNV